MVSSEKLLRLPEVIQIVGLSRSTIYLLMQNENFPQPIKLTSRSVAWPQSRVESWIDNKMRSQDL